MTEPSNTHSPAFPKPVINDDVAFLYEGFSENQLRIQRCRDCNTLRMPPCPSCPHCRSHSWDTITASGRGRIHSFTVLHHPPIPPWESPHPVVLADLEEGVRFLASLTGDSADLAIDMPVEIEFLALEDGFVLPAFKVAESTDPEAGS